NSCGGSFCEYHEANYGSACQIKDCENIKIQGTQACNIHQDEWKKYKASHSSHTLADVRRMLRRPAEQLPWNPIRDREIQLHDQPIPNRQVKNYFGPSQFYCVETIVAPCGVVIGWAKFAKSESPSNILHFLESVYPTEESWPDYVCIDKACLVLCHLLAEDQRESWNSWKNTTRFIVDSYHYTNH
ncbi:hypothetical protein BDQ12DRAFT_616317, partial [Crucibulum laeve]